MCSEESSGSRRTNLDALSRITIALIQRTLIISFASFSVFWLCQTERTGVEVNQGDGDA